MIPILTSAVAATLIVAAAPASAAPHARYPDGPVLTNGSPMPPQVFAPEATARVAGRNADRAGSRSTR